MKYGFIGLGNMAGAIIQGMHGSAAFDGEEIYGFNRSPAKTERLAESCGLIPCGGVEELVSCCDVVVLAVKPQVLPDIIGAVARTLRAGQLVLSIAAGKTLSWYAERLPENTPVVRVMPNISAKVGCAVSSVCGNAAASEEQLALAERIFASVGRVYCVEERLFPAFSAIGGAAGAFVYLFIDALADSGVKAGFPRPMATELATQVVLGAAKLQQQSGEHPVVLMNQVCSPGGTTIEGVLKLKQLGFESAVNQGIDAIIEKDLRL